MSDLRIYRASAGSGKTYTLTNEFILLLFKQPYDYKHLLAVTFTNKATAEMKSRIIKTLYSIKVDLDQNKTNAQIDSLVSLEGSPEKVKQKAVFILYLLLHDFSRFSVTTIDSFFQKVIRAFIQELGIQSSFKTELNSQKILIMAVDRLIMKLGQKDKSELRKWLIQSAKEDIIEGETWNISKKLVELGNEIYSESFQSFNRGYINQLSDRTAMDSYKNEIKNITVTYKKTLISFATKGLDLLKKHQLEWDDFPGKSRTSLTFFKKMRDLDPKLTTEKIKTWIDNPDEWLRDKKNSSLTSKVLDAYNDGLNQTLKESVEYLDQNTLLFNTANVIYENLNSLAIINDIVSEIDEICREEMVLLLANSNKLLYNIIDKNDAPFIYEKCGNAIKHYMIDEFQDTSTLQWNNFKPLIENSLAANNYSLIVGDVKQSIYRWRNSDWNILAQQVKTDFEHLGTIVKNLDTNWRSSENIIVFNNLIFKASAHLLQNDFNNSFIDNASNSDKIINAYADVAQKVSGKNIGMGGQVSIEFIECKTIDEYTEIAVQKAVSQVEAAISLGFELKDICILVRKKSEAKVLTDALLSGLYGEKPYAVVSNEALTLSGSIAVSMVINQMNYILNPANTILSSYLKLYKKTMEYASFPDTIDTSFLLNADDDFSNHLLALKGLPLLDLVERLINELPKNRLIEEGVFLQSLIDLTSGFVQKQNADLANFLEWWATDGSKKSVSVPENQNAIRVMTIHKSKGLEFDVVIMPFLNWSLDDKSHREFMWCEDPLHQLNHIPIKFTSKLIDTLFTDDYQTEHLYRYVDNLNLLYVAFTRAKKVLFGLAPLSTSKTKDDDKQGLKTVSDLIRQAISSTEFQSQINLQNQFTSIGPTNILFGDYIKNIEKEQGDLNEPSRDDEFETTTLPEMKTWDYSSRISIFMESADFISLDEKTSVNKGKIMHHLFEQIKSPADVKSGVMKLHHEGFISESEMGDLEMKVHQLLDQNQIKEWFKPGLRVLNEKSIISSKGNYIPDRVIIDQDEVIVIDYKFGESMTKNHITQVKKYMDLIREMNYQKVKGYLWYINENQIIDVSNPQNPTLFN